MENLDKTNGAEPVSAEVVSRVDEILSDFFGKLDNAIQSFVKQHDVDPDTPSNSELQRCVLSTIVLDQTLAKLIARVDSLEENDPHEIAVGVVEDNGEGFLREDDLPDQILNHVGETLDKDEIVKLIKETIGELTVHTAPGVIKLVKKTIAEAMYEATVVVEPPVLLYGKVQFPEGYGEDE